jgi:hypothetical protein
MGVAVTSTLLLALLLLFSTAGFTAGSMPIMGMGYFALMLSIAA